MILKTLRVTKFQSVQDSNEFEIGDITCLVGKNEAGKTSLLKAIYRLNPIIPEEDKFSVTDDYPRSSVEDYRHAIESKKQKHDFVISAKYELGNEIEDIKANFGENALLSNELVLKRGYENRLYITLLLNEVEIFKHIINSYSLTPEVKNALLKSTDFKNAAEILKASETSEEIKKLQKRIDGIIKKGLMITIYDNYVEPHVPKFLYFDEFYQLIGAENIEELIKRKESDELKPSDMPMLGLIELARLDLDELVNPDRTQTLINKLQGASNHLSKQILKYWSQNKHLKIDFDVRPGRFGDPAGMRSGNNIWAQIYDQKRWVSTNLGSRSRGFVWFFSFLSWYSKTLRENDNIPFY